MSEAIDSSITVIPPLKVDNTPKTPDLTDYTFKLNHARNLVRDAIKSKKIFCIQGCYPVVRYMLKKRGWLERDWRHTQASSVYDPPLSPHSKNKQSKKDDDDINLSDDDDDIPDFKQLDKDLVGFEKGLHQIEANSIESLCGRMLKDEPLDRCNFFWMIRTAGMNIRELGRHQMINHFPGATFTTKSGIMDLLNNHLHWACDSQPIEFFPRCYKLSNTDQRAEFIKDYKISTAICVLRIFAKQKGGSEQQDLTPRTHTRKRQRNRELVSSKILESALKIIQDEIAVVNEDQHSCYEDGTLEAGGDENKMNEDGMSVTTESASMRKSEREVSEDDRTFFNGFYKLVYNDASFEPGTYSRFNLGDVLSLLEIASQVLTKYQPDIMGQHNLWIVKPGAKSRGRGIQVQSRILEILRSYVGVGEPNLQKDGRWIIQKYIERPLLVHETKFDIRQWFLIDNWSPLKIWLYRDSYLRFSSKKFSLTNHSQAIHLCNHSIQKNLDATSEKQLPDDNMWVNKQFVSWFEERYGVADVWTKHVWPQMLEITQKVMLTALESGNMEGAGRMKGSFELYGADFMLTVNEETRLPKVWLVEINSSPTMALSSSKATHKLCREVLEDTVNLVLAENRYTAQVGQKIGGYELAYVHNVGQKLPNYSGEKMSVEAIAIKKPLPLRRARTFRLPGEHTALRKREKSPEKQPVPVIVKSEDIVEEITIPEADGAAKKAEDEAKIFSRKLNLRKVSAQKPSSTPDSVVDSEGGRVANNKVSTPTTRRKQLPKLERKPLMQREHKPKSSELLQDDKRKNAAPYISKLPKRTAKRTPMAIAVCSSQTTLTPVGSKASPTVLTSSGNNVYPKCKGDHNQEIQKLVMKSHTCGISTGPALPFPIKSSNLSNSQYLTSPNATPYNQYLNTTNNSIDINYSFRINGKLHQKRTKTFAGDNIKLANPNLNLINSTTKIPRQFTKANKTSSIAPFSDGGGGGAATTQTAVSVVDMSSWLHRGHTKKFQYTQSFQNLKVKHTKHRDLWHPNLNS